MSPVNSPVRGTVSPVRGTVVRSPVRGMGTTSVSHSYDNGDNGYDNYSDYIGVQSIIVRLFLLFESLVIFPTWGIIAPQFLVYYAIYTLISTSVSFSKLVKREKLAKRKKVYDRYNNLLQKRLQNLPPSPKKASMHPPPPPIINPLSPPADLKRLSLPNLLKHVSSSNSLALIHKLQLASDEAREDLQDLVIAGGGFMIEESPMSSPAGSPRRGGKEVQKKKESFFQLLLTSPFVLVDSLLSKKRVLFTLFTLVVHLSRTFLHLLLDAQEVRKYLILISVSGPTLFEQYELLFGEGKSVFNRTAMTSFTIHSVSFLVLFLCVSYEVPGVYGYLSRIFGFCYEVIFPVGVVISGLEGWRKGAEGDAERKREGVEGLERVADLNVRPPHTLRTPPTTPRSKPGNISPERVEVDYWDSQKGSDTATCASSIMLRNERVEDVEEEDEYIDDVDLRMDRHHVGSGEDYEEDGVVEEVDKVSICASTKSVNEGFEEGVGEMWEEEEGGGGEGTGEGLRGLNLPIRPVEVQEFFQRQESL
ncbi:hypothetical protein TrST_g10055 [Triparma strigata]|nr:hypothetical protein TrST_g10055 [Triparma strigata]